MSVLTLHAQLRRHNQSLHKATSNSGHQLGPIVLSLNTMVIAILVGVEDARSCMSVCCQV